MGVKINFYIIYIIKMVEKMENNRLWCVTWLKIFSCAATLLSSLLSPQKIIMARDERMRELMEFIEKNKESKVELKWKLLLSIYFIMHDLDNTCKEIKKLWETHDDLVWLLFKFCPREDYEKRYVYLRLEKKPELTHKFGKIMKDNFGIGLDNDDLKKKFDKWFNV